MRRVFSLASTPFRAVVLISGVWLAIGWLVGCLVPLDSSLGIRLPLWFQFPGIVAILAGGALVLICGVMLSTRGIGTLEGEEWCMPRDFVATGPFRFVRNPMSLGGVMLMTGIALWHRSAIGLGLAAMLFLVMHIAICYWEEPGLEKRFGDGYRAYRRNVPRWVPRVTPWQQAAKQAGAQTAAPPDGGRDSASL